MELCLKFNKQKNVSVLNLFLSNTSVLIIITVLHWYLMVLIVNHI